MKRKRGRIREEREAKWGEKKDRRSFDKRERSEEGGNVRSEES